MNAFQEPMQPFAGLEGWARQVTLPASGLRLFLYDTGEGAETPVVLLHGLGDEADTWRHVLPALAADHRVIAPDLPGFGRSGPPPGRDVLPFYLEMLLALLDAEAIPRAVLVGHSAGAMIAQAFALEHPARVERLVLVSGGLVSATKRVDPGLLLFMVPGLGEWIYTRLRRDPQAAYRTLEGYYHRLADLSQADRDFLYRRVNQRVWSDSQRRGFFALLRGLAGWLPAQQKRLAERLRGWSTPTTVIWGEDDRVTPVANARALAEMLPAARLVLIPSAGHNVQQEQPQAVVEAINVL